MKLVSYQKLDGTWQGGELRDGEVFTLGNMTLLDIIKRGGKIDRNEQFKMRTVPKIGLPFRPPKIFCVGRNYAEHAAELGNALPDKPLIFSKYPTSVIGQHETIEWHPDLTQKVDWEGELAVVIGKTAKNITEEEALDVIFGYTIANDVSARDLQDGDKQWARAKGMDTFCPLGPVVVTKDEIEDPHNLSIQTRVNGQLMQDGHTSQMFFKIPYLVAYLSRAFTLEAGDVLLTGTPAGVGKGMNPPLFLTTGDEVSVTIEGIGTLTNVCRVLS
jgi:2-keto-4-pentenoate hydratase/2-oxohepta-3-ene-1,7-dioic acid hydratase in catechol pathway